METRKRLLTKLTMGVLIVSSHLEALNHRVDNWIVAKKPTRPGTCPLGCGGLMARDYRPSPHLEWSRCTGCGMAQEGVRVREAA
jgi:hypothetical protein